MAKLNKEPLEVTIQIYNSVDDCNRIEYRDHIIQVYGYEKNEYKSGLCCFVIDENGHGQTVIAALLCLLLTSASERLFWIVRKVW